MSNVVQEYQVNAERVVFNCQTWGFHGVQEFSKSVKF